MEEEEKSKTIKFLTEQINSQARIIRSQEILDNLNKSQKVIENKINQISEQKTLLKNHAFARLIEMLRNIPVFTDNPDFLPKLKNLFIDEPRENHSIFSDLVDATLVRAAINTAIISGEITIGNCEEKVFMNHVILQEIFKHLKTSFKRQIHLCNARLVCKAWNSAAVSQTLPQFTFNVRKFLNNCPKQEISFLEQRLLRRIVIPADSNDSDEDESNFINLLKELGTFVQEIELDCDDPKSKLTQNIVFLLENNLFPNLKRIEGFLNCKTLQRDTEYVFPAMRNLTKINIFRLSGSKKFVKFLEALIKGAPNLLELTLAEAEIPISSSSRLKKLKINCIESCSSKNLLTFLRSCTSTLEQLFIKACQDVDFTEYSEVPKMPKLVKFEVIDYGDSQELFKYFKPEVIPNLKELSIIRGAATYYDYKKDSNKPKFLGLIQYRFENLVILKLDLFNPKILEQLNNYCPSLQDLTVILTVPSNRSETSDDSDTSDEEEDKVYSNKFKEHLLEHVLHYVKHLPLKNFSLVIPFEYDLSVLIVALGKHYFQLFSGLKTLRIHNTDNDHNQVFDSLPGLALLHKIPKLDLLSIFCDILLAIGEIEGLDVYMHNFQFNAITAQRIMKIVDKFKIPVHFTC